MLGKIIGINENEVHIKIDLDLSNYPNLIGTHVSIKDNERTCVGEITDIKDGIQRLIYDRSI